MDIDADPFDERDKTDEATGGTDTTDERIPLIPMGGDSQIDPSGERETSFGVEGGLVTSLRNEVLQEHVKGLYEKLGKDIGQNPEVLHYDLFDVIKGNLYYIGPYKDLNKALTRRGRLLTFTTIAKILGKEGLREMGFDIPKGSDSVLRALMKLPSASDIGKANEIEMQELTRKAIDANEDLIREISSDRGTQTGEQRDPDMPTMRELVGLDKELRSIRGSLKVEAAKKVELEEKIKKENRKLEEI